MWREVARSLQQEAVMSVKIDQRLETTAHSLVCKKNSHAPFM